MLQNDHDTGEFMMDIEKGDIFYNEGDISQ